MRKTRWPGVAMRLRVVRATDALSASCRRRQCGLGRAHDARARHVCQPPRLSVLARALLSACVCACVAASASVECYAQCDRTSGPCPSFCGEGQACCRRGHSPVPECFGNGMHACDGFHCCVAAAPTPTMRFSTRDLAALVAAAVAVTALSLCLLLVVDRRRSARPLCLCARRRETQPLRDAHAAASDSSTHLTIESDSWNGTVLKTNAAAGAALATKPIVPPIAATATSAAATAATATAAVTATITAATTTVTTRPRQLDHLTGCRFFLSLWIACNHFSVHEASHASLSLDAALRRSNVAVCAFVLLSGFVTHHAYATRPLLDRAAARTFYLRRIGRVALTTYVAMAAALVLGILLGEADYQLHAPHLLRCALLVENWQLPWRGDVFWCPAGNTWTIVALLPSWGLYPLTAAAVAAAGATLGTVGLVAYACALWTVEMAVPFGAFLSQTFWLSSKQHEVLYFWPVAQLTDFVIGVLASEVSRRVVVTRAAEAAEAAEAKAVDRDVRVGGSGDARSGDARSGGVRPPLCRACSSYGAWAALADASVLCVMFACFCTPWPGYRVGWEPFFDHGLVLPLSVFLCASACDERALCVRLLSHPALVSLGSYSFDVFLFQFPLKQLFTGLLFSSWTGEVFLLYLLTLWTIAGVYAETVEARAVAWLRRVSA